THSECSPDVFSSDVRAHHEGAREPQLEERLSKQTLLQCFDVDGHIREIGHRLRDYRMSNEGTAQVDFGDFWPRCASLGAWAHSAGRRAQLRNPCRDLRPAPCALPP